ncbi:hypothetical protein OC846_005794 [Tilletia horrida]|uniref:Tyrosinase copper-binding domain-containing protein n=1 Tax=Tilletia horrida TaxID=155126 RepID=A0AAN6JPW5_9BASI|nr:hypothetical protein OC846_005794 [Tilletia horrida]KAK0553261.1 hypothetical protein OC845_001261 [Tilletia horrida]
MEPTQSRKEELVDRTGDAHRTSTLLHFTQSIYLLFAALYVCKESVEHALLHPSGGASVPDQAASAIPSHDSLIHADEHRAKGPSTGFGGEHVHGESLGGIELPIGLLLAATAACMYANLRLGNHARLMAACGMSTTTSSATSSGLASSTHNRHRSVLFDPALQATRGASALLTTLLSNPFSLTVLFFSGSLTFASLTMPSFQIAALDKVLAGLESVSMGWLAWPASLALGKVLLQTAPEGLNEQRKRIEKALREIEEHHLVSYVAPPHLWQLTPPTSSQIMLETSAARHMHSASVAVSPLGGHGSHGGRSRSGDSSGGGGGGGGAFGMVQMQARTAPLILTVEIFLDRQRAKPGDCLEITRWAYDLLAPCVGAAWGVEVGMVGRGGVRAGEVVVKVRRDGKEPDEIEEDERAAHAHAHGVMNTVIRMATDTITPTDIILMDMGTITDTRTGMITVTTIPTSTLITPTSTHRGIHTNTDTVITTIIMVMARVMRYTCMHPSQGRTEDRDIHTSTTATATAMHTIINTSGAPPLKEQECLNKTNPSKQTPQAPALQVPRIDFHGHANRSDLNASHRIDWNSTLHHYVQQNARNRCTKLHRRVEWRSLSIKQQRQWIEAQHCIARKPTELAGVQTNLPGLSTSLHDAFSLVHIHKFYQVHYQASFLPWHRMLGHARAIAAKDCGYHGPWPYWDWTLDADAGSLLKSPILSNERGLGGNGTGVNGTVTSGPLGHFPLAFVNVGSNQSLATYAPHYLQRSFGTALANNRTFPMFEEAYNTTSVRRVLSSTDYVTFERLLEGLKNRLDVVGAGPHSAIHIAIAGEMFGSHSPNDPIFFLHHANIDRLWWSWQIGDSSGKARPKFARKLNRTNPSSKLWAYSGNTVQFVFDPTGGPPASLFDVQTLDGLVLRNMETFKLMDIERPPLCYTYG